MKGNKRKRNLAFTKKKRKSENINNQILEINKQKNQTQYNENHNTRMSSKKKKSRT